MLCINRRNEKSFRGRPARTKEVNLEYWKYCRNLGDSVLPKMVYEWMLQRKECDKNVRMDKTIHLLTIGSIIGLGNFDAVIWGSGINKFEMVHKIEKNRKYVKYDIRIVRGPLTREILLSSGYNCPPIYGDPGVLLPLIYPKENVDKKYKFCVLYHHATNKREMICDENSICIDMQTKDYKKVVNAIMESEVVISSSLHGIILAEAYGVPTVFLNKGMDNQLMKFYDWYYSTGRMTVNVAMSLEEAMKMKPMQVPDLSKMQRELLSTFPYDLWGK